MSARDDKDFAPPPDLPEKGGDEEEYVFRFQVETPADAESAYDDPLVELIRGQLADLLDAVSLTHRGQRVAVDGFRLVQEPETQYEIFPHGSEEEATNESA